MGLLTSPCLWVILICDFPWPFSADARRGVSSWPHKKKPKVSVQALTNKKAKMCPTMSLLCHPYLLSWCLQICNHSLFYPPPMCSKYTIPYAEVSGMRGWWRAGPVIFLWLLKLRWPTRRRVALCQRVFHALLTNYLTAGGNYFSFHLLLLTHNHASQAQCGVIVIF